MNKVIMMGRIVNDLELSSTPSGVSCLRFRLAVDRNFQKKDEERKSDFFNVTAWRGTAEYIERYFAKGRMILVEGELQTSQYNDKNGDPSTWYEIVANNVYFTGEKSNSPTPQTYAQPSVQQMTRQQAATQSTSAAAGPSPVSDDEGYPF